MLVKGSTHCSSGGAVLSPELQAAASSSLVASVGTPFLVAVNDERQLIAVTS